MRTGFVRARGVEAERVFHRGARMRSVQPGVRLTPANRGIRVAGPAMVAVGVLMGGVGQAEVQGVAQTGGPPLLPIPQFLETGLPTYTMPVGRPSEPSPPAGGGGSTDPGGSGTGTGGTGDGADSPSMAAMTGRSWGAAAAQNAETVGVTPVSVAATCMIEAGGCQTNPGIPGANGTINGTFQMTDATYRDMMASALARNPSLAATVVPGLAGKLDPATQSIAAAEYQRQGAVYLQAHDIANPTVLDVRGYYNFGPAKRRNDRSGSRCRDNVGPNHWTDQCSTKRQRDHPGRNNGWPMASERHPGNRFRCGTGSGPYSAIVGEANGPRYISAVGSLFPGVFRPRRTTPCCPSTAGVRLHAAEYHPATISQRGWWRSDPRSAIARCATGQLRRQYCDRGKFAGRVWLPKGPSLFRPSRVDRSQHASSLVEPVVSRCRVLAGHDV